MQARRIRAKEEAPFSLCDGTVNPMYKVNSRDGGTRDVYYCESCNLEIDGSRIAPWYRVSPKDRGEALLHRNFLMRNHAMLNWKGNFRCMVCGSWFPELEFLMLHFKSHRYAEIRRVVPAPEWKGSQG